MNKYYDYEFDDIKSLFNKNKKSFNERIAAGYEFGPNGKVTAINKEYRSSYAKDGKGYGSKKVQTIKKSSLSDEDKELSSAIKDILVNNKTFNKVSSKEDYSSVDAVNMADGSVKVYYDNGGEEIIPNEEIDEALEEAIIALKETDTFFGG